MSNRVIRTPAGAIEERVTARTRTGKSFVMGRLSGNLERRRVIVAPGPAHFRDSPIGSWRTRDLAVTDELPTLWSSRLDRFHMEIVPDRVGFILRNREGRELKASLVGLGGQPIESVSGFTASPEIKADGATIWRGVVPGLSIQLTKTINGAVKPCHIIGQAFGTTEIHCLLITDAPADWAISSDLWGVDNSLGENLLEPWLPGDPISPTMRALHQLRRPIEIDKTVTHKVLGNGKHEWIIKENWTGNVLHRVSRADPYTLSSDPDHILYPVRMREFDVAEQITSGSNDGDERGGSWVTTGNVLIMGDTGSRKDEVASLFVNVPDVGQGATVSNGQIRLGLRSVGGSGDVGNWRCIDADDPTIFQPSLVTGTTANTAVDTTTSAANNVVVDINSSIQEVVNRAGWLALQNIGVLGLSAESYYERWIISPEEATYGATPTGMFLEFDFIAAAAGGEYIPVNQHYAQMLPRN